MEEMIRIRRGKKVYMNPRIIAQTTCLLLFPAGSIFAEMNIADNKYYSATMSLYDRTELVSMGNTVGLDDRVKNDRSTYISIDYYADFKLTLKDEGPSFYVKAERKGPYNYDAPVLFKAPRTSVGKVERYEKDELLPFLSEFWADIPIYKLPLRVKTGLFTYIVGNGIALTGSYQNYGVSVYDTWKDFVWRFYYAYPDLAGRRLGPDIRQEEEQGIGDQNSRAHFFSSDVTYTIANGTFQPYVGLLADHNRRRSNLFSASTKDDLLGTVGMDSKLVFDKFTFDFEWARNFGRAKSEDTASEDVEHAGYFIFSDASYEYKKIKPHARFAYSSGNSVTLDMVNNGDSAFISHKNKAFSSYSPLNTFLADSVYPKCGIVPLLAMGNGYGLNYGVRRPGTFGDPYLFDNLVLCGAGLSYQATESLSCSADWWHLNAAEGGVGIVGGEARHLSRDLGNEFDFSVQFQANKYITVGLLSGLFIPGKYYREVREDTAGSLFSPFVRGDGSADCAYQIEFNTEIKF